MKVSASKKTIAILIVLFLLLLLGGIYFLYKDVIHNGIKYGRWFTVDKYEELLDDCEWERKGRELVVKCRGLLDSANPLEKGLNVHCYNFTMLSKEVEASKSTSRFNICEENQNVVWKDIDEWIEEKDMTHVIYSVKYKKNKHLNFKYSSLEIKTVDHVGGYPTKATYDGIELTNHQNYFGEIRLYNSRIKEKYLKDGFIYLNIEGNINGRETLYNFRVKTKGFYVGENEEESTLYVNASNLYETPNWKINNLNLIYTTASTQSNLNSLCKDIVGGLYKEVCKRREELKESDFKGILNNKNDFFELLNDLNNDLSRSKGILLLNINAVPAL